MAHPSHPPSPATPARQEHAADTRAQAEGHANTDAPPVGEGPTLARMAEGPDPGFELLGPLSLVGQTLGDFEILAEIGRGGMGVVYKARQLSLERVVALKMLLGDHFRNPASVARFQAEARAAAALAHPNIVGIYQVGECGAGQFFAMEFIEGRSLDVMIQDRQTAVPWATTLMAIVADAVHFAHTRGIVHRDLKPANIMIDRFNRPVVMDFGLAKVMGASAALTREGAVMGTPAYMPPEQAAEETFHQVGPASDIYSLGAILYTLLAGQPPYGEGNALSTLLKLVSPEMPAGLRQSRPEVSEDLEAIVMKCLAKRPADRYPDAHLLAKDLRRVRAGRPVKHVTLAKPALSPGLAELAPAAQTVRPAARSVLVLISFKTGQQVRLSGESVLVGRASECDLVLKSSAVSKRHCQIYIGDGEATVEDLSSVNGTYINGHRIERDVLHEGDQLNIGGYLFQVRFARPRARGKKTDPGTGLA